MEYRLKEWVQAAKKGDVASKQVLLEKLYPLVASILMRYGREEWEDMMQDAGETILRCIQEYDEEQGVPFLLYVKMALTYRIRNQARRKRVWESLDAPLPGTEVPAVDFLESAGPAVGEWIEQDETARQVRAVLECLSPEQREVLIQYYYNEVPLKEIARRKGVHYQSVIRLKRRALLQMKKALSDQALTFM